MIKVVTCRASLFAGGPTKAQKGGCLFVRWTNKSQEKTVKIYVESLVVDGHARPSDVGKFPEFHHTHLQRVWYASFSSEVTISWIICA